ncbi:MAG: virulence RhuM family protein [Flavobacteriales bacterium]|nr:virulence RhuM family protein [Flavobacteriales bacterium]
MSEESQIVIYKAVDGQSQVDVKFDGDTIWLSQTQMAEIFEKDSDTIGLHLKNIFESGELDEKATTEESSVVRKEGTRNVKRKIKTYNLDAVISVGYRVNSVRGTQFRIWANQILKSYLTKGYAVNELALKASESKLKSLQQSISLLENVMQQKQLSSDEAVGLIKVVSEYSHALDLLDKFDHQSLTISEETETQLTKLTYKEAIKQIGLWRDAHKAGNLFGNEKDKSFKSSLETIYQTFEGKDLYPGTKTKAAQLLYFVVKNHSFSDGNKRIAAGLFVYFLDLNGLLYSIDGNKIIEDNALVAITLMIAESDAGEMELMIKMVVNLMG